MRLLQATLQPTKAAIIHCQAHQKGNSEIIKGLGWGIGPGHISFHMLSAKTLAGKLSKDGSQIKMSSGIRHGKKQQKKISSVRKEPNISGPGCALSVNK